MIDCSQDPAGSASPTTIGTPVTRTTARGSLRGRTIRHSEIVQRVTRTGTSCVSRKEAANGRHFRQAGGEPQRGGHVHGLEQTIYIALGLSLTFAGLGLTVAFGVFA